MLDRMNQRVVSRGRLGGVKIWAWTVSIVVHLLILTGFVAARFSDSQRQVRAGVVPTASLSRQVPAVGEPVIPKPKIKRARETIIAKSEERFFSDEQIFGSGKPVVDAADLVKPTTGEEEFSFGEVSGLGGRIEFFGSFTDRRKICYLVDCSGSMKGMFGKVKERLAESISGLEADHYFYIIFFGGGSVMEFGEGRLVRATEGSKESAYSFIESVEPSGQTNALEALVRALKLRDSGGARVGSIYFLTDGFELGSDDVRIFSQQVSGLLNRFSAETRIDTIGFWPQREDRAMLEAIASQSGGRAIFIENL